MSRTFSAPGTKPGMWNVSWGLVAPEWRSFHRDLAFAFLYWNGEVIDLLEFAKPNAATAGNATRTSTPFGVGIDHAGRLEFDTFAPLNPGTGGVTMLTYANAPATGRHTLVCQRVGNQDEHLEIRSGQKFDAGVPGSVSTVDGHLFFQCDDGTVGDPEGASTQTTTVVDGDWHVFAGRRTADGVTSVWSDGEDVTEASQTDNTEDIDDTGTFVLGGLPGTATIAYQDNKLLDMGWNRDLSDAEMALIGADPFGWIRMHRREAYLTTAAPPGGLSIPVAMHHYKQMMGH